MQKITPNLWFDTQAEEAATFYTSIFPNSKVTHIARYGASGAEVSGMPEGTAMTVSFELDGQEFIGINGGPMFTFTEAVSFMVHCKDQAEVDYYWEKLSANPASEQCGWLKDKFGLSWQIVPTALDEMMSDPDPLKVERTMKAMLQMKKLDVTALRTAYEGTA